MAKQYHQYPLRMRVKPDEIDHWDMLQYISDGNYNHKLCALIEKEYYRLRPHPPKAPIGLAPKKSKSP